jgi:hypothetical protein
MLNEKMYTVYSGITLEVWRTVWQCKNLTHRETNVTTDLDFAFDYSYDFVTGKYEELAVEISNVPLEAFVAIREEDYQDDEDTESLQALSCDNKAIRIDQCTLFLLDLLPFKDVISVRLVSACDLQSS